MGYSYIVHPENPDKVAMTEQNEGLYYRYGRTDRSVHSIKLINRRPMKNSFHNAYSNFESLFYRL